MSYISQIEKKSISAKINPILKEYNLKGTLSIRHHSQLVLKISTGPIDFFKNFNETAGYKNFWNNEFEPITSNHMEINQYHYKEHFSGVALEALSKLIPAMYTDDFRDNSRIECDFFDISYYISVRVGEWNKPYMVV